MCGIAGFIAKNIDAQEREAIVRRMIGALLHRGPDEQAVISSGEATFGVARLSIIDRRTAQQPMALSFNQQRGLIAYNGEVYNFNELYPLLESRGVSFRTHSDTEAVLAAHLVHGPAAVESLDGMFAYAVWNQESSELLLVRDRLGIKPLFYVDLGHALIFASEPKAIFCYPGLKRHPNFAAILEYFLHGAAFASGYVTGERSFFEGVSALPPGHIMSWTQHGARLQRYWSPLQEIGPLRTDQGAAEKEVAETITKSIHSMLMGEVPIGTALSGGLDSSLLTVEAARVMDEPLVSACITYRASFDDQDALHATLLSNELNREKPGSHLLEYTYLQEETYLDHLDDMIQAFDEPHWEPRQLAMFENYRTLSQAGRTIVLTGEGADELFFGYYRKFPGFRTPSISNPADFARLWRQRLPLVQKLLRPAFMSGLVSDDLANDLIEDSISAYLNPYWKETGSQLRAMQCWYLHTFLPWLLMDNDRCSMAHSLEGRFPFLSKQMTSLALQLPPEWNIATDGVMQEKILLRRAAANLLPVEIWHDRVKSPLPVPDASSYHHVIARQLEAEVKRAHKDIWEILDRQTVLEMIGAFYVRARSVSPNSGESLTSYIALGEENRVRTAQLFGILTFIRWHEIYIQQTGKESLCVTLQN
ncbi:MAG: hypothetical protein QOJ02_1846 [Acidobacteriota bacterium]|nr:hypothetical protein [Acidobacteriota bacterium]